jgi:hypothetical protein
MVYGDAADDDPVIIEPFITAYIPCTAILAASAALNLVGASRPKALN